MDKHKNLNLNLTAKLNKFHLCHLLLKNSPSCFVRITHVTSSSTNGPESLDVDIEVSGELEFAARIVFPKAWTKLRSCIYILLSERNCLSPVSSLNSN